MQKNKNNSNINPHVTITQLQQTSIFCQFGLSVLLFCKHFSLKKFKHKQIYYNGLMCTSASLLIVINS